MAILEWKKTQRNPPRINNAVPVTSIQHFINNCKYSADTVLIHTTQVLERFLLGIYIYVL
jgi:hypothetical protein